jgi:F-box/leucine-rich repeat protein 16
MYKSICSRGFDSIALSESTDIDLKDFSRFLKETVSFVNNVKVISLRFSPITDHGLLLFLDGLPNLRQLDINSCNEMTEAGLWNALHPKITKLSISDCINVGDESVRAITQKLPNLQEFTLQAYHVTDHALAYFSPKQTNTLNTLRLHSCWEITNHGLVNLGKQICMGNLFMNVIRRKAYFV